jgi:hypothetical protein
LIWIALLTLLLSRGAGAISADALVARFFGQGARMHTPHIS